MGKLAHFRFTIGKLELPLGTFPEVIIRRPPKKRRHLLI